MKYKFLNFFLLFLLLSCAENIKSFNNKDLEIKKSFAVKGFALVYNLNLYKEKIVSKKINPREYIILNSFLKSNTYVKIFNPSNSKFVIAKVKNDKKYPKIYSAVLTERIVEEIDLDISDPYIELIEIQNNNSFIAKKAEMFDEEKNVANKAPVTDININIITDDQIIEEPKKNKYVIVIGEYYFLDSANIVKARLINEGKLIDIKIKKISLNNFRVFAGAYSSFNAMKDTYFTINNLGFEHLDILQIN